MSQYDKKLEQTNQTVQVGIAIAGLGLMVCGVFISRELITTIKLGHAQQIASIALTKANAARNLALTAKYDANVAKMALEQVQNIIVDRI